MSVINRYVIILSAGVGVRYADPLCKQFQKINGVPVIVKTILSFLKLIDTCRMRLVIHHDHQPMWIQLKKEYPVIGHIPTIVGGEQRFHSVQNALHSIICADDDLIGIHDGVRPCVTPQTIQNAYETAEKFGAAVPVVNAVNTIRIQKEENNEAIDRKLVKVVQNPQVFRSDILKSAYRQSYSVGMLDDATVVETAGYKIYLCEGNYENIKITYPQDINIACALDTLLQQDKHDGYIHHNTKAKVL